MPLRIPKAPRSKKTRLARAVGPDKRDSALISNSLKKQLGFFKDEVFGFLTWVSFRGINILLLSKSLNSLLATWKEISSKETVRMAERWAFSVSSHEKEKLQKTLAQSLGVEYTEVFDELGIRKKVEKHTADMLNFIQPTLDEYFDDLKNAVLDSYQQKSLPGGVNLSEYIEHLTSLSYNRSKLIAVDQTNKLHSAVTQERHTSLGIEAYEWSTLGDERVVGNPFGKYPKPTELHGNHFERNGKKFLWSVPPSDGHPGVPIRCRCRAKPIIEYDKLVLL